MSCHDSDSLYRVFCQVTRFHYCRSHVLLEKIGVYPGQHPLLFSLSRRDGQSQKELADKLHIKASTITVMLNRMENANLIERRPDHEDRRISRVYLTEHGRKTSLEVKKILKRIDEECFNGFTVEERVLLRRLLMQMRQNLITVCEDHSDSGGHEDDPPHEAESDNYL